MKRTHWITAAIFAAAGTATLATGFAVSAQERGPRNGGGIEQLFERLDTDGNGEITQAEAEAAAALRFAEADTNGDGVLSAEEMAARSESRRAERVAARAERMIERLDTNDDGALSLEEIAARGDDRGFDRLFDRFDANDDGVITQAEAEAAKEDRRGRGGFGQRGHRHN